MSPGRAAKSLRYNPSVSARTGEAPPRPKASPGSPRPRSVLFADRGDPPADVIVYATGFGPVTEVVVRLTSPEVAAKVGSVCGYGSGLDGDQEP